MARFALVLTAVALTFPAAASARTITLKWHETLTRNGKVLMGFTVRSITLHNGRWQAVVSFKNRSRRTASISRKRFGLAVYPGPRREGQYSVLYASKFKPRLPLRLRPGHRWFGQLSGRGVPAHGSYMRVRFGSFTRISRALPTLWSWITNHNRRA